MYKGGGKLSSHVANGTRERMKLFFKSEDQRLDGICVNSIQRTPESLRKCLRGLNLLSHFFCTDSCGLQDIHQSAVRLPILSCIGSGGLHNDDAIQLLHTMYVIHVENRSFWSDIMKSLAISMGYTASTIPKRLGKSMQTPLMIIF